MRLGVGTAQFGMPYGATNAAGQVAAEVARAIMRLALEHGVDLFDTAPAYGGAESLIGAALPAGAKIITKTRIARRASFTSDDVAAVRESFLESLGKLRRKRVYGLLVHSPDDLSRPGGSLIVELLLELRERAVVQKVGVSVYSQAQLEHCLRRYCLDLYQIPMSYIDQRIVRSGLLDDLARSGAEIHARSVFLQGVLLARTQDLPDYFSPWRARLEQIRGAITIAGVAPSMGALAFVRSRTPAHYAIVGATSPAELQQLLQEPPAQAAALPFDDFSIDDERLLDPSQWPPFRM